MDQGCSARLESRFGQQLAVHDVPEHELLVIADSSAESSSRSSQPVQRAHVVVEQNRAHCWYRDCSTAAITNESVQVVQTVSIVRSGDRRDFSMTGAVVILVRSCGHGRGR